MIKLPIDFYISLASYEILHNCLLKFKKNGYNVVEEIIYLKVENGKIYGIIYKNYLKIRGEEDVFKNYIHICGNYYFNFLYIPN